MGDQRQWVEKTTCRIYLYKSNDCDGSKADQDRGEIQRPFKKISMHGKVGDVRPIGNESFNSMLINCSQMNF